MNLGWHRHRTNLRSFPRKRESRRPRTQPKNWGSASAGTSGMRRRFKLSSSRLENWHSLKRTSAARWRNGRTQLVKARGGANRELRKRAAATAPCGQYAEGCLRAASNIARHLSYSGVPGLSVPVRHFCSSVCACANCCDGCDDDAHPAKVRANTIADTSFI